MEGVTAIDTRAAALTVRAAVPLFPPDVAVIVAVPWPRLLASPAVLIVATAVLEDCHVADVVRFFVVPSV